jgi:hypothetical protein
MKQVLLLAGSYGRMLYRCLPITYVLHVAFPQGLMASLSVQMTGQLKDLISRLARYIDRWVGSD